MGLCPIVAGLATGLVVTAVVVPLMLIATVVGVLMLAARVRKHKRALAEVELRLSHRPSDSANSAMNLTQASKVILTGLRRYSQCTSNACSWGVGPTLCQVCRSQASVMHFCQRVSEQVPGYSLPCFNLMSIMWYCQGRFNEFC